MAYTPSTAQQAVEALYIGYFGRAGEPGGVAYWVGQINAAPSLQVGFERAAAAFSVQAEAKAQHPFLANSWFTSPADFVESLYLQLFGRSSDAAGKAYWVAQLQAANGNPFAYGLLVAQFISGAQNDANGQDLTVLQNKVTTAEYFTGKLMSSGILGTDSNGSVLLEVDAAATDVISGVTKDVASIIAASSKADAFVSTVGGGNGGSSGGSGGGSGSGGGGGGGGGGSGGGGGGGSGGGGGGSSSVNITLSVNADGPGAVLPQVNTNGSVVGDEYHSIVDGVGSTLNSVDVLDGLGGNDTLNVTVITGGAAVAPTLTSIETVSTKIDANKSQEISLALATSVITVVNKDSAAGSTLTYSNVPTAAGVSLKDVEGGATTIVSYAGAAGRSGASDAFNLTIEGVGSATNPHTFSLNGDATFEVANITASGKGSVINLLAPGVDTIKATGAATAPTATGFALSLVGSALTNAKNIDASGLTAAGLSVDLGSAGNTKAVTFTGSGFNNTALMGGGLTTADKLDGKAGTNTIGISDGATLVSGLQVTNFQILDIAGANASSTYDVSKLSGITGLLVSASLNQGVGAQIETINNLAKGASVTIAAALGFPGDGDGIVVNVKDASAGSPNDSIAVNLNSATALTTTGNLTINDIETVTINATSSGTGVTHTLSSFTDAVASTINVNASTAGLNINAIADPGLVLFDASASVKAVSVTTGANAFTANGGVAFNLGAASDTLVLTGSTFAAPTKGAIVTGNGGGDTITLEAGAFVDTIVLKAATDSQVGATKFDTVNTFDGLGGDKIDLRAFGFTGTQAGSFDRVPVTAIGPNGEVAAGDAANFFVLTGTKYGVAEVASGANTWVYVDVNKDGNWDAGDSAVLVTGVTPAALTNANYVFA